MSDVNKIAIVTGASRGIGRAIAMQLANNNIFVIGTATTIENAEQITKYLKESNLAGIGMALDLNDISAIDNFVTRVLAEYGTINILVNNAGITKDNLFMRMKLEDWNEVLQVNLTAVAKLTQGFIKNMIKAKWGRIINISSVVGAMGNPGQANYCAAKAGMIGFTKSLALEIASRNITVNAIAPGFIQTDMTAALTDEQQATIANKIPMKKLGSCEHIAQAVSFLSSTGADYITGQTIHVNGGLYLG